MDTPTPYSLLALGHGTEGISTKKRNVMIDSNLGIWLYYYSTHSIPREKDPNLKGKQNYSGSGLFATPVHVNEK